MFTVNIWCDVLTKREMRRKSVYKSHKLVLRQNIQSNLYRRANHVYMKVEL